MEVGEGGKYISWGLYIWGFSDFNEYHGCDSFIKDQSVPTVTNARVVALLTQR